MANRTLRGSLNIHGTNPQFLVEKTIRSRIYDSRYWKEHCFALTAESILDPAVQLTHIGGTYALQRPSPFLCLLQKLLQLQPQKEIVLEYLNAAEFKYLRALAAMYIRLTFRSVEVYELLEPLLNDYRKLRFRDPSGTYSLTYMDVFIDSLLTSERVCDLILPRLTRRDVLEETEGLAPRTSKLEDVLLHGTAAFDDAESARGDSGEESDDSAAEARRQRRMRMERAAALRAVRLHDQREDGGVGEEDGELIYASQEESQDERGTRYISRSPSRSLSPEARGRSRSPPYGQGEEEEEEGWKSRSPTASPRSERWR
ncbi:hypothetical protein ACQY0O_005006 [Thecaphora frezii]